MNLNELIRKHFPHENYNPGQENAIVEIVNAFRADKSHVILQSPTGTGKSAIATTVHRVMREYQPNFRTTIVTATKGLQDQYENEDPEIYDLKGKKNYDCPQGAGFYNSAACRQLVSEENCEKAVVCPYFKRRTHWTNIAPLRLTNTSFQIEACTSLVAAPENIANLVVIDECHGLDEHLVNHSILSVNTEDLLNVSKVAGKDFVAEFINFVNEFLETNEGDAFTPNPAQRVVALSLADKVEKKIEDLNEKIKGMKHGRESMAAAIEELQQYSDKLRPFGSSSGEWILTKYAFGSLVVLKPVYAHQVSDYGMFRKGEMFLHMSATICGFDEYIETLGIKKDDCVFIDVPNPIPVENRKVHQLSFMKVSGDFDRGRLTGLIDKIVQRHGKENGIIHSVSFKLAEEIKEYSAYDDRMLISNNRFEIMDYLSKANSGRIVVSPSIVQGYDFKGDLSRWQVLPKIGWGFLGDSWVKLNMERDQDWYNRKAILSIVQSCGRSVRGINDHATTYILDATFDRLLKNNRHLFPSGFVESIIKR